MLNPLGRKKAQSTAEYAIIIALVIAAAVAMQTYVKRSMQGSVKYAVDRMKKDSNSPTQYEPYYVASKYTAQTQGYTDTAETKSGGAVERVFGSADGKEKKTTIRSGSQIILDSSYNK